MKYERLLEIAVNFAEIYKSVPESEEDLWRRVKSLKMTQQEMQEIGLQRYEPFSYSDKSEDEPGEIVVIWDNLNSAEIKGLSFESKEEAVQEIQRIVKKELEQENCDGSN